MASGLLSSCSRGDFPRQSEDLNISNPAELGPVSGYKEEEIPAVKESPKIEKVFLSIDFISEETKKLEIEFREGMTVSDLLQEGTGQAEIFLQTKMYSLGVFIERIGDKKNGLDNKYWVYYVNGKFAPVAADKFKLKAGDKVEWKFEKSPL